jgi:hypothetical protein
MDARAKLEARVTAVNECRQECYRIAKLLREAFEPQVGRRVTNVDNGLRVSLRGLIPTPGSENIIQVWHDRSEYVLRIAVKACVNAGGFGFYHTESVDVGRLDNHVLAELSNDWRGRDNYTADEVEAARKDVRAAERALASAKGRLGVFGMYDN